jgi:cytochrome c biogenesis protein CcdA
MLGITILIYLGIKKVDEISGWKERNIRKLHLIAGILLIVVGILILKD